MLKLNELAEKEEADTEIVTNLDFQVKRMVADVEYMKRTHTQNSEKVKTLSA